MLKFINWMIFQVEIGDFTGTLLVSLFEGCAEKLLGDSADELAKIRSYNADEFLNRLRRPLFKTFSFRITARQESSSTGQNNVTKSVSSTSLDKSLSPSNQRFKWNVVGLTSLAYEYYIPFLQKCISKFH